MNHNAEIINIKDTIYHSILPKHIINTYNFNKVLRIRIMGDPIPDSRPRVLSTGAVFLVNKALLEKRFSEVYKECDLLKRIVVTGPYIIGGNFFVSTTKKDIPIMKQFGEYSKVFADLEKHFDVSIEDVDNYLKSHNDVMFTSSFHITTDDAYNVGFANSFKYLSDNPRAEIDIVFSDKPKMNYIQYKQMASMNYLTMLLSEKAIVHMHRINTSKEQLKYIKNVMEHYFEHPEYKHEKKKKDVIKKVISSMMNYSNEFIRKLADIDLNDRHYNRNNIIILLIEKMFKKSKYEFLISDFRENVNQIKMNEVVTQNFDINSLYELN